MEGRVSKADVVKVLLQQYESGAISEAAFGKALRAVATDGDGSEPSASHWEYQEFTVPLSSLGEFQMSGWPVNGGIPYSGAIGLINKAVQAFVNSIATQGWEPTEPIDADRLYRANRITGQTRQTMLHKLNSDSVYQVSPQSARINCRRRVPG